MPINVQALGGQSNDSQLREAEFLRQDNAEKLDPSTLEIAGTAIEGVQSGVGSLPADIRAAKIEEMQGANSTPSDDFMAADAFESPQNRRIQSVKSQLTLLDPDATTQDRVDNRLRASGIAGALLGLGADPDAKDYESLTEEQFKANPYYREGMKYEPGMTVGIARIRGEESDTNATQALIASKANVAQDVLSFTTSLAAGVGEPKNLVTGIAAATVISPMIGMAANSTRFIGMQNYLTEKLGSEAAGKIAASAIRESIEGGAGGALAEPSNYHSAQVLGDDYTMADSMFNMATNIFGSAAIGGAVSGIHTFRDSRIPAKLRQEQKDAVIESLKKRGINVSDDMNAEVESTGGVKAYTRGDYIAPEKIDPYFGGADPETIAKVEAGELSGIKAEGAGAEALATVTPDEHAEAAELATNQLLNGNRVDISPVIHTDAAAIQARFLTKSQIAEETTRLHGELVEAGHTPEDAEALITPLRSYLETASAGRLDSDSLRKVMAAVKDTNVIQSEFMLGDGIDSYNDIGKPLKNGFFSGPEEGSRFRIGDTKATGGILFEKRTPTGTASSFYIGKDGGLIDAETVIFNKPETIEPVWKPETPEQAANAKKILHEMGKLKLDDPKRKDLKNLLKQVVKGEKVDIPDFEKFNQNSVTNPAFKKWFGDSKVVDKEGKPITVYHGTTHNFESFSTEKSNIENDFGAGFYFSNTAEDVANNYAGEGPDLTARIENRTDRLADNILDQFEEKGREAVLQSLYRSTNDLTFVSERVADMDDSDASREAARVLAKQELAGDAPNTIPAYLSIKKPVELGGDNETYFDYQQEYNENTDEYGDETGSLVDLIDALRAVSTDFDDVDIERGIGNIMDIASGEEGISASELIKILKSEPGGIIYAADDKGELAGNELMRRAFEYAGYDGIIDQTVNEKFGTQRRIGQSMAGVDEGTTHYIAFYPEQIKSAIGNKGTFDPKDPNILNQSQTSPKPFYSALERNIESIPQGKGSPAQWQGIVNNLQNKGVKAEEIEFSGITEWLKAQKGQVTKQDIQDFLRGNSLEIEEVTRVQRNPRDLAKLLSDETDPAERERIADEFENSKPVRYAKQQLPGGDNYKELLLTLPEKPVETDRVRIEKVDGGYRVAEYNPRGEFAGYVTPNLVSAEEANIMRNKYASEYFGADAKGETFRSSHYPEPNIFAHVRFNERVDADGKKVLFMEEVQSDWHQEGRRKGYRGEGEMGEAELNALKDKARERIKAQDNLGFETTNEAMRVIQHNSSEDWQKRWEWYGDAEGLADVNKWQDAEKGNRAEAKKVPDAPFKKSWHEFVLKRMLRYAVDNGFDKIGWTTGEQQADRYNLSKHLNRVMYWAMPNGTFGFSAFKSADDDVPAVKKNNLTPEQLEGEVGKDLASKIVAKENPTNMEGETQYGEFSGLDLKLGDEGMKGFYDKILPNFADKYAKKWGGKVTESIVPTGEENINTSNAVRNFGVDSEQYRAAMQSEGVLIHSLEITPAMRDAVKEGQPLFQPSEGENTPRGSITFKPMSRGALIQLFNDSNKSTFLHETGHMFLNLEQLAARSNILPDAVRNDHKVLLDWLGVESFRDIGVDQHEQFARGFEAYLRDGQAPSAELRSVFERFKQWLTALYKSASELDVTLSPEIRGVFDRMLATDEQIKAQGRDMAKGQQGFAEKVGKINESLTGAKSSATYDEQAIKDVNELNDQYPNGYDEDAMQREIDEVGFDIEALSAAGLLPDDVQAHLLELEQHMQDVETYGKAVDTAASCLTRG